MSLPSPTPIDLFKRLNCFTLAHVDKLIQCALNVNRHHCFLISNPVSLQAASEEEEAATSTSEAIARAPVLSADPSTWSIDDVIHYISQHDVTLGQYAELFQKHVSYLRDCSDLLDLSEVFYAVC